VPGSGAHANVDSDLVETATADPLVGHTLEGRYRIVTRLARGGMSTVYAAVDERLDRRVAVKVMSSSLSADPAFVDRFAREARVAARLSHVNAVSVYDQGHDAGKVFLVMELVTGRTLRDLLDERGHLSPAEAVSIMEPVLAALAAAHRAGLVHRDVKPENILLADDGLVKVADFGLASAAVGERSAAQTGLMMGTVAYSSPERFRGVDTGPRTDVYSAGIVLFELLVGRPPFQGDPMSVAYQHVQDEVPPPSSLRRGLAAPIDAFVQSATARDPAKRPVDAGQLLVALHDLRKELHLPVLPVPRRPRPGAPSRHSPPPEPMAEPTASIDLLDSLTGTAASDVATGPAGSEVHHTAVDLTSAAAPKLAGQPPNPAGPPPTRHSRRRRHRAGRALASALVVFLVCAAAGYSGWWLASGRYRSVPNVRNEPSRQAVLALQHAGFKVGATQSVFDSQVRKGSAVRTDPASGKRARKGAKVRLFVSNGPRLYTLPDLTGKNRTAARTALAPLVQAGVVVTYTAVADDATPRGRVVRSDPEPGTNVHSGSAVTVFMSTGPPLISVPDVRGKSQQDATATLTGLGFSVSDAEKSSDTVPAGTVLSQTPAPGTKLAKFKIVTIVVSKGPDLVQVPQLPRLITAVKARNILEAVGFKVEVQRTLGVPGGLVLGTDPAAGTKLKRGATVTLIVI
jgi:beta-lactam-binding protein with PASTA domain/serine/threonine protein kinase